MTRKIEHQEYTLFQAVPYARAKRWQKPELFTLEESLNDPGIPCKEWQIEDCGPFYNKEFYGEQSWNVPMSEDCLILNIWSPRKAENAPVVIWIHGGGFDHGYALEKEFDGAEYAKRGIVFVSIQYRLGVFGFLIHPWMDRELANLGLQDQIAAVEWVIRNISHFGGDPENITLMGQSAGAISVQILASTPALEGKIQKAILQSGGSFGFSLLPMPDFDQSKENGRRFMELLQVSSHDELLALKPEKLLEAYQKMTADLQEGSSPYFLVPCVDGLVLPEPLDQRMETGRIADLAYMIGSTKDDISNPQDPDGSLYQAAKAFSHQLEKLNRKPAWVYSFERDLPGDDAGAFHSSELWYTMGTLSRSWRPFTKEDQRLSERMMDYWTNFIRTGNPNDENLPEWKAGSRDEDVCILNV